MKPVRNPGGAEQLGPSSYSHSIHHRCWRRGLVGCFFVLLLVSSSPWRFSNGNGSVSWVVGASNDGEEENGLTPAITPPPPTIADLDAQDNERFRVSVYLRERRALMGLWRALSHNQGPGIEQQQQSSSKPNTKTDHCQWEGISCVAIPKTVGGSRSTGTTENTNTTNILNTENNNIDEYYTNDGQHLAVVVVSIQWTHRAKHWAGHPLQYDPQQQHSSSVHRKPKQNATAAATALDSGDALDDGNDDDGTVNFDAYWTDLVYLMQLDLSHNQLAGTIPHTLLTHAQLKYLDLSHNQLQNFYYYTNSESDSGTASHGTNQANHNAPWFPSLLGLFLDSNALSGSLRELWDQLATHGMVPESPISGGVEALAPGATATATLVTLDLSDNFLTGTVPSEQMKKKMMMNQQQHQPEDESFFGALTGLWVADNLLTGSLPSADDDRDILFSLSSSKLQILDMSRNLLTGPVGNLLTMGSLKNLHHLILTDNEFMGPFPSIPIAPHPLQVWDLSRNFFTGTIPENSWSMLKDLCTLIVSRNRFIGTLPIAFMVGQASSLGQ